MKSFMAFFLLVAFSLKPSVVLGVENIIISKSFINKLCVDSCHQSSETQLSEHCERGCRFFDYAQTSDVAESNEAAVHLGCVNSCEEAYSVGQNQNACVTGCGNAKTGIEDALQMGTKLLEEADKEMSFLTSFFNMMTSSLWSNNDEEASHENNPVKEMVQPSLISGKRIDYLDSHQWAPKSNKLDPVISRDEVEFITMMANDMDSESTLCATRMWLHRLSFILIVMGSMSLLFISFFYLLAFIKHKKSLASPIIQESTASADMSSPPSYETLVKGGFIVVTDGANAQSDKDDKPFLA